MCEARKTLVRNYIAQHSLYSDVQATLCTKYKTQYTGAWQEQLEWHEDTSIKTYSPVTLTVETQALLPTLHNMPWHIENYTNEDTRVNSSYFYI